MGCYKSYGLLIPGLWNWTVHCHKHSRMIPEFYNVNKALKCWQNSGTLQDLLTVNFRTIPKLYNVSNGSRFDQGPAL